MLVKLALSNSKKGCVIESYVVTKFVIILGGFHLFNKTPKPINDERRPPVRQELSD